ncbi:MAG: ammonium transporter [Clostridiales bacterium]|jgi:Amt family ammonium transporter|nr:ammonium transporter [Clostridiales bacterium]
MELSVALDTLWLLIGAFLVFIMHAGFTMVETGFTRAKNAGNIIMKNIINVALGTISFWLLGFGIMFGLNGNDIIGGFDFLIRGDYGVAGGYSSTSFIIFQTMFCATAATIVSGAMAERTKFSTYCIYAIIMSMFIYPISGHWIWDASGWLAKLGFHDFAGSTVVHMVGGLAALIGAKMLGPRIGKYTKSGKSNAMPGHSLTLGALGVLLLWFGWFGFNGASTFSIAGEGKATLVGSVFITTNLAAAIGTVTVMIVTWIRYKKPDVSMTLNGALAGLVGVTAGADVVTPLGAAIIGLVAGIVVVFGVEFVDKKLKIDDPVGAIGVHFCCGAVGTLLVGLLDYEDVVTPLKGLFYGGGLECLGVQSLGVVAVAAWVAVSITIVFVILKKTIGLRVSVEEETLGLDITEHALESSYADFAVSVGKVADSGKVPVAASVPVTVSNTHPDAVITKVVIVTKQSKFEALKDALEAIGITGMTVTQVLGHGLQKGSSQFYRGVPVSATLLPKVKVEVVISKIAVSDLVNTAKKALYTGNIGDGKIFIYDVRNVVRVSTNEEGYDALQDK